jgi:hypothetical protein
VKPRLSIFGDLGGGVGVVREMKVSASLTPSTYEVDEWRTLMSVGLGVRVKLSEGYDLFALQRWLRYDAIEYDTFNRGGTFLEHVVDQGRGRALGELAAPDLPAPIEVAHHHRVEELVLAFEPCVERANGVTGLLRKVGDGDLVEVLLLQQIEARLDQRVIRDLSALLANSLFGRKDVR